MIDDLLKDITTGRVLKLDGWHTPCSEYPTKRVGSARLWRSSYSKGHYYRAEGIGGYDFFISNKRMPIMCLQRNDLDHPEIGRKSWGVKFRTWMVDDYLHWAGMKELVGRMPAGHILCAGLGLGIMVHHLDARPDIEKITVCEIDSDVIELIAPLLPNRKLEVVNEDYYKYIMAGGAKSVDGILWDLAVGNRETTDRDYTIGFANSKAFAPDVPLYQFGLRDGMNSIEG